MVNNDNLVKIAVNKSLLKEFLVNSQRTVYMNNGSEFQIQIFNPYTYSIGASISINGVDMHNQLVIKPGQRVWLERYLNEARKFLFETYEVNGESKQVENAIKHNGVIEIKFYKEKNQNNIYIASASIPSTTWTYFNDCLNIPTDVSYNTYSSNALTATLGADNLSMPSAKLCSSFVANDVSDSIKYTSTKSASTRSMTKSKSIETGRIEKGNYSNQKFQTVYNDFEYLPFTTETIHILPQSAKPVYANDLKKIYCTNCGRKLNNKFKFCPYCGTKCIF